MNVQKDEKPAKDRLMVFPLSGSVLKYPCEVEKMINEPVNCLKGRGVGARYGIYWLHYDTILHLWAYDSVKFPNKVQIERKYGFMHTLRCVSLGKIYGGSQA